MGNVHSPMLLPAPLICVETGAGTWAVMSQFGVDHRFRYVSPEGRGYRGNGTNAESLHGLEGKFVGALGRS